MNQYVPLAPLLGLGLAQGDSCVQWVINVLVNAATNYATGDNMFSALIVAIIAGGLFAFVWHRKRTKEGLTGVEPWHLQIAGLAGIIVFAMVALGGVVWERQTKNTVYVVPKSPASEKQSPQAGPGALYAPGSSGGRLEVGKVVGAIPRIVEDHGQNNAVYVGETNDGAAPLSTPTPLPWLGTEFSKLSNAELKKLAISKSVEMRPLAIELGEQIKNPQTYAEGRKEVQKRFVDQFRGTCSALAAEILARQKIFPPYDFQVRSIYPNAFQGHFAGPNPIAEASAFLEDRARMLPDD